jgi:hypothetical protein
MDIARWSSSDRSDEGRSTLLQAPADAQNHIEGLALQGVASAGEVIAMSEAKVHHHEGGPRSHPPPEQASTRSARLRHQGPTDEPRFEEIRVEECLEMLRRSKVGRISLVVEGFPVILPVNYRLVETEDGTWLFLRTRAGTTIDRLAAQVGFQIDWVDVHTQQGWSVLVQGRLRHVEVDESSDIELESWASDRDTWLVIEPLTISGRRLHPSSTEWPFHPHGYL